MKPEDEAGLTSSTSKHFIAINPLTTRFMLLSNPSAEEISPRSILLCADFLLPLSSKSYPKLKYLDPSRSKRYPLWEHRANWLLIARGIRRFPETNRDSISQSFPAHKLSIPVSPVLQRLKKFQKCPLEPLLKFYLEDFNGSSVCL